LVNSLWPVSVLIVSSVIRRLGRYRTQWQVPGQRDGASVMLDRAAPDVSAMLSRMRSRQPSSQMPPLGTVVRDQEAIAAIERWMSRGRDVGGAHEGSGGR
jgi:hypothetical protein